jgi:membrane-bound metal-dependent hydrolase YbcI (DUF457 family)
MIAGHFGLAAGVKRIEPRAPLWALMLAAVWLDVLFVPLLLLGIETIEPIPGTQGGYGNAIIHADYTHSLVGAAVIALLVGLGASIPWGRRVGAVLAAVVFSHWLLDLVVHRADMPILPGNAGGLPRLGFGLWRLPAVSIAVELALVLVGALLYWRAAEHAEQAAGNGRANWAARLASLIAVMGIVTLAVDIIAD